MNSHANKTELFRQAINADADERCKKIRSDVDRYVEDELKKTRRLARTNVRPVRSSELDRLNEEINTELSENEIKETKKLIAKRNEAVERVLKKATDGIIEFTKSEKYTDFILESVRKINSVIGENSVISLRPADKAFEDKIKALGSSIKYDSTIVLGGCKGENFATGLTADDTLDARLEAEKKRFYEYSKLYLSL